MSTDDGSAEQIWGLEVVKQMDAVREAGLRCTVELRRLRPLEYRL